MLLPDPSVDSSRSKGRSGMFTSVSIRLVVAFFLWGLNKMPLEMKPIAGMHPKALASIKPKDRPKTDPPKIDKSAPSLKAMREMIVSKKPAKKEVVEYFREVVERLCAEKEKEDEDGH